MFYNTGIMNIKINTLINIIESQAFESCKYL